MQRTHAVVLAAGSSTRMGDTNKLLLPVNGLPLVRHTVNTILEAGVTSITVVTGHDQAAISGALAGLPIELVHNANHTHGKASSVLTGLSSIDGSPEAVMISLSDQPALSAENLIGIHTAFLDLPDYVALVPVVQGKRGNPVVLSYDLVKSLIRSGTSPRDFLDEHPEKVRFEPVDDLAFITDVDTPEQWRDFQAR